MVLIIIQLLVILSTAVNIFFTENTEVNQQWVMGHLSHCTCRYWKKAFWVIFEFNLTSNLGWCYFQNKQALGDRGGGGSFLPKCQVTWPSSKNVTSIWKVHFSVFHLICADVGKLFYEKSLSGLHLLGVSDKAVFG